MEIFSRTSLPSHKASEKYEHKKVMRTYSISQVGLCETSVLGSGGGDW